MRSHQPKERTNNRLAESTLLKVVLLSLVALLIVAAPQLFSAHAGASTNPAQGVGFTVNTTDDHDDGACNDVDCSLREAMRAANNTPLRETIDFSVTGTINLGSALPGISDPGTIAGPGAKLLTVQANTGGPYRIFDVTTTGAVTISGLTIKGGLSTPGNSGGGIRNFSTGTVNVDNCVISLCGGAGLSGGGGISNGTGGTVNVNNSTIRNNEGSDAGGVINIEGTLTITNSTITENFSRANPSPGAAGGVSNLSGTLTVMNSIIRDNHLMGSESGSGAINSNLGTATITNSTISGNRGGDGGAIANRNGQLTITNSTISGNTASARGGGISNFSAANIINSTISGNSVSGALTGAIFTGAGIFNSFGALNVTNSTISNNVASGPNGNGGGIFNFDTNNPTLPPGTVTVRSSIIALNTAIAGPDVLGPFTSAGFNLVGKSDLGVGFNQPTDLTGTVASPLDPMLDPNGLRDNGGPTYTVAPLCGSPAIDKGTADGLTGNLFTDQRATGFPRIIDDPLIPNPSDGADIGAFELDTQNCNHPPVALCKNIQVSAGSNCQAGISPADVDNGSFDPDQGDSIAMRSLDNSGPFALGPHTVTLTVTDTHGASSSCTATVTVVDTTPPTGACPPNKTVSAVAGQCQAVVSYPNPMVSDNCPGAALIGCAPPSGSTFSVGTTTVTCTAKDAANNIGTCQFIVIVLDTQPPTITCPANLITVTANPGGASVIVNYLPPTASDNCNVTAVCSPPSGTQFPRGTTTVICTANDGATNTATCTFTVTVFDVCVEDDTTRDTMLLNSQTGDYLYRRCGTGGFSLSGRGSVRVQGSIITVEHYAGDRRVTAKSDNSVKRGSASLQYFARGTTFTITDRNTTDNTCACP